MWAALNSPLLMGNDLRKLSASAFTIFSNPAVIAINQDPLGKSCIRRLVSSLTRMEFQWKIPVKFQPERRSRGSV